MLKKSTALAILAIWFALAYLAGALGYTAKLRPPLPQVILLSLTAILIICGFKIRSFRKLLLQLNWRLILGFHLIRFIGFYFINLYLRGALPFEFAVLGGIGDIAVAYGALTFLIFQRFVGQKSLVAWNIFGLVDILFVVFTATRLALINPQSMSALLRLPLSLLVTFIVPLVISSHILLLVRGKSANFPDSRS